MQSANGARDKLGCRMSQERLKTFARSFWCELNIIDIRAT
jgi:hypothetical protein